MSQPSALTTPRLLLRPFNLEDAPAVQELAGEWDVAATTGTIPHPYPDGAAEEWIERHREICDRGDSAVFAIVVAGDGSLVGAIGLEIDKANRQAELGYWIGKPHWGQGYGTEAARRVLRYAFEELALNRVYGLHMTKNPASGRVMEKLGMKREGTLRQALFRWKKFEDLEVYAMLREEWGRPDAVSGIAG